MSLKVTKLPTSVYVKEIDPDRFEVRVCDCLKRNVPDATNYFNLGFFAMEGSGKTVTIGNVVSDGEIISSANANANWINVANKSLSTIYVTNDEACGMLKTKYAHKIPDCTCAISGIPVVRNGAKISMNSIKTEGYFGNELYNTWHGFLGIRDYKLVYVAAKCEYDQMYPLMMSLGIKNAIKLDGGGSFILKEGDILQATSGNSRINSVGIWK